MNEFSIGGAWTHGCRFIARGTAIHFLILVLLGIAAPLGVQYAIIGVPMNGTSPMAGPAMMQMAGVPSVLLTLALSHMLQAGSYFASLRFGLTGAQEPGGAIVWGLAGGLVATLVIAMGYLVAIVGGMAIAAPGMLVLVFIIMMLPLFVVYSLFFLGVAIMIAGTIIVTLVFLFVYGAIMGYPELATVAFGGSGVMTVIMLVMSGLLFWLAARFSCVLPVMAERENLNVFGAIAESWRLTSNEQGAITRYLALVGLGMALVIAGISLAVGASTGGLMQGRNLGLDTTGELVIGLVFGTALAFLSAMLAAGIYRQLTGDEAPTEVFE